MNYFGGMPNYQMPVAGNKYGYSQNAMVLPGAYGGDPYSVVGNSPVGASGYGAGYLGPSAPITPAMQQQYNFARSSEGMAPVMGFQQPPPMGFQRQPLLTDLQHPLMRNRGMRPFRGQNALNSMYGQMPSPYASVE